MGQIFHTRIRTQSNGLNAHLFSKNIVGNPFCICGQVESPEHYVLNCAQYDIQRRHMLDRLSNALVTVDKLIYGDSTHSDNVNSENFIVIQEFILHKRFNRCNICTLGNLRY